MIKYILILVTLIAVSCKKADVNTPYAKSIVGKWQLVSYGGGFDGKTHYPAANEVSVISFNKSGYYIRTINGTIEAQGKYELGQAHSIYSGNTDNALKLDGSDHWNIISIHENTLEINSNAYDGGGSTYVKVP